MGGSRSWGEQKAGGPQAGGSDLLGYLLPATGYTPPVDFSFGSLLLALVIGSIGLGLFIYGRKQGKVPPVIVGIALIVYPYFVPNPWISAAIAAAALGLLWGATRVGF